MGWQLFGVTKINPLWQKQNTDDDHLGVKLLCMLYGFISGLWTIPVLISANFSIAFLNSIQPIYTPILQVLANFPITIAVGFVFSTIIMIVVVNTASIYDGFNLYEQFQFYKTAIYGKLREKDKSAISSKFGFIILCIVLIGYITGFIYGLLYTVPHFVLFFLLTILFSNFIPFSPLVMTFAIIIGFLLIAWYTVRGQLDISEEDEDRKDPKEYQISLRNFNIIKSQQEPIVCQNCRSFIPASSKRCPVCLETITDNS